MAEQKVNELEIISELDMMNYIQEYHEKLTVYLSSDYDFFLEDMKEFEEDIDLTATDEQRQKDLNEFFKALKNKNKRNKRKNRKNNKKKNTN